MMEDLEEDKIDEYIKQKGYQVESLGFKRVKTLNSS